MAKVRRGELNLLLLQQSYLVRKLQSGQWQKLGELKSIELQIEKWYATDFEKVKLQARAEEIENAESVRIYHHELHKKHLKRTSILKLDAGDAIIEGHTEYANFLANSVAELLLNPAQLLHC